MPLQQFERRALGDITRHENILNGKGHMLGKDEILKQHTLDSLSHQVRNEPFSPAPLPPTEAMTPELRLPELGGCDSGYGPKYQHNPYVSYSSSPLPTSSPSPPPPLLPTPSRQALSPEIYSSLDMVETPHPEQEDSYDPPPLLPNSCMALVPSTTTPSPLSRSQKATPQGIPSSPRHSSSVGPGTSPPQYYIPAAVSPPPSPLLTPMVGFRSHMDQKITVLCQFKYGRLAEFLSSCVYETGEHVIVEGDRGEDLGMVIKCLQPESGEGLPSVMVKRIATPEERDVWRNALPMEESQAVATAQEVMDRAGVPLQIQHAEFQFDRKKLTFHYTSAEPHPDFRLALHDMYRIWHCRIWMNRVQRPSRQSSLGYQHHLHLRQQ